MQTKPTAFHCLKWQQLRRLTVNSKFQESLKFGEPVNLSPLTQRFVLHFGEMGSRWAIFRTLAAERRKREIDPTLSMLRDTLMGQPSVEADIHAQERMRQMWPSLVARPTVS